MTVGFGLGPPGLVAFAPPSISGLMLWPKADSLSLNDGDPITTWTDSSGNTNNAVGSGTARPLYKTNIINSLPVVRFDGSNDTLQITRNAGLEPNALTLFAVIRAASTPADFSYVVSKPRTSASSQSGGFQSRTATGLRTVTSVATTGEVVGQSISPSIVWDGSAHIACLRVDGAVSKWYLDGILTNHTTNVAVGNISYESTNWFLGSYDGTSLFMAYDLGELLLYNTALSDANRWRVQGYLGNKWAIP